MIQSDRWAEKHIVQECYIQLYSFDSVKDRIEQLKSHGIRVYKIKPYYIIYYDAEIDIRPRDEENVSFMFGTNRKALIYADCTYVRLERKKRSVNFLETKNKYRDKYKQMSKEKCKRSAIELFLYRRALNRLTSLTAYASLEAAYEVIYNCSMPARPAYEPINVYVEDRELY